MFELNPPRRSQSSPSQPALEVELRNSGSYIQWRYKGFAKWNDLISITDLQGEPGKPGKNGQPGTSGTQGIQGPKGDKGDTGPRGLQGEKGTPGLDGSDGKDGKDGREIELRVSDSHIQWRYVGDPAWKNLIKLSELKGPKGDPGKPGEKGERGPRGLPGREGSAGERGPRGPMGYTGPAGPAGVGVPEGGTTGQVLAKTSDTDFATDWVDQTGGGGSSGYEFQNEELTSTYAYVGYEHITDGSWYIYRRTRATNVRLYASGSSDYATNWTDRASLTYA